MPMRSPIARARAATAPECSCSSGWRSQDAQDEVRVCCLAETRPTPLSAYMRWSAITSAEVASGASSGTMTPPQEALHGEALALLAERLSGSRR